jgi:HlyD family secretion protein
MKKLLAFLFLAWAGAAGGIWYWNEASAKVPGFRTVALRLGDLQATVNASGTLEPEEVVDVGAQIAAEILSFGPDPRDTSRHVSHGTPVEQGTVLARLDDKLYLARVNQAKANVAKAKADLEQSEVKRRHADRELERGQRLLKTRNIPAQEFDTLSSDAEAAKAAVAVAEGALELARANLEEANVNLGYTTIRSPVKGVVVDRRVNIGQTVVASLNAPSLFLIAKDLKRMQIWASVNETDVGQIYPGQGVRFTVSAFPKESFEGKVQLIRLNASMTQSVVTYTVVVEVDNTSGKLLPYLTARLQFEQEERSGVLLVPNAALRWTPAVHHVAPAYRDEFSSMLRRRAAAGPAKERSRADKGYTPATTLWVREGTFVRPVPADPGLSDGLNTEVSGRQLSEGMEVVVGLSSSEADEGASPFLPQIKNDRAKTK